MAIRLQHVNIRTSDLQGTIDFYTKVIGLSLGDRPDFDFAGAWLYDDMQPAVHLREVAEGSQQAGNTVDHFAFYAESLDAAVAHLDKLGISYRGPKYLPGTPLRQCFLEDPNGVIVELQGP
jgi:catechol 2,3-dioxygenase-like lactoylglutathione lyase family enzyme